LMEKQARSQPIAPIHQSNLETAVVALTDLTFLFRNEVNCSLIVLGEWPFVSIFQHDEHKRQLADVAIELSIFIE
jgi:hypothetical protein